MTKPQLWQLLVERNPQFDGQQCTFKAGQVRKLFDLVWDQAQEDAMKQGRARRVEDMFKGVFGGGL